MLSDSISHVGDRVCILKLEGVQYVKLLPYFLHIAVIVMKRSPILFSGNRSNL
ncbi:hypothetical protein RchiOBHm_Chr7g0191581 [Rosa chinensis]|uniref:Uncharacterized protein n=1 Tax=Rosa chinensis TaxID=74649 RepID=A0A2P6P5B5_ROSCH|nr:hypothetical protein RchiOBHm_Chr7g0191581 [Rosa chinensis]